MAATSEFLADNYQRLQEVLRTHYGMRGSISALHGNDDHNLLVEDAGRRFVCKFAPQQTSAEQAELVPCLLEHLAQQAPDVDLQRLVRTQTGRLTCSLETVDQCWLGWMQTWVCGRLLADVRPQTAALHGQAGALLARIDLALTSFDHPALATPSTWNLHLAEHALELLDQVEDPTTRSHCRHVLQRFRTEWSPQLETLPKGTIHGDGNDHNLLVSGEELVAAIDFGDVCRAAPVCEVAIAASYAMLASERDIDGLCHVTAGYNAVRPLDETSLDLVAPLALTRMAFSLVQSAVARRDRPTEPYGSVHEAQARRLLHAVCTGLQPWLDLARARVRQACGRDPWPEAAKLRDFLVESSCRHPAVLGRDLPLQDAAILDLSFASLLGGDDPEDFDTSRCHDRITAELKRQQATVGIGRYGEPRPIYSGTLFGGLSTLARRRTVHLGIDLFAAAGTPVHAPLTGSVVLADRSPGRLDYGGYVLLRHTTTDGTAFGALYGHLDPDSLASLQPGTRIEAGQQFARLGAESVNGDWPPHLHFQLCADDPQQRPEVPPGVADPDDAQALQARFPDPGQLLGLPAEAAFRCRDEDQLRQARSRHAPANLRTGHGGALHLVRGRSHFVYDRYGRRYLDAYNNVPHVGHGHPRVADAVERQFRLLATNTRYLSELLVTLSERLVQKLPPSLTVCLFTPSGSEANELALRLARAHTQRREIVVMEHGYHGHTTGCLDVSPYKWRTEGPGPRQPSHVHTVPQPCTYRGPFRGSDAGSRYAAAADEVVTALVASGRQPAAFLSELAPSVGGQVIPPADYFRQVYSRMRAAGVVCIGDDVQTGFGRLGDAFFGFELHDAPPDVLVLGKPFGNGYPLAAVVTTQEIAASFAEGPEFFSTHGGNTVACAAGIAVLDVLADERLQDNARRTGAHLMSGLQALAQRHEVIGDVRGRGLFLGVDLVRDRDTRAPATAAAGHLRDRLRQRRVLIGTDGPFDNVLKIRPPMTFDIAAADTLLQLLDDSLGEDSVRSGG